MFRSVALILIITLVGCSERVDESRIPLSEAEIAYIASRPVVSWIAEENRPPYIFIQDNYIRGLSVQYIELISKKTGLVFEPVRARTFTDSIKVIESGQAEIITALRPTVELSNIMNFTEPIAHSGGVFVFRENFIPRSPLTVSIRNDNAAIDYIERRFPQMKMVKTLDDEEAIALLQRGLVDAAVTDAGSAEYLVRQSPVKMRIALIDFEYPFSLGYTKNDPMLGSILTKAINAISPEDKSKLNRYWFKG